MASYNEILEELKNTLQKDDVESNEEQISLYDLFNIINSKFELLRSVTQNKKLFTSKQVFHRKKFRPNDIIIKDNILKIEICFAYYLDYIYFKVCYDMNSKDIFFEGHESMEKDIVNFIKKYNEELINIFSILEIFHREEGLREQINKYSLFFKYYVFKIICDKKGIVDLNVHISSQEEEIKDIYERKYYDKKDLYEILGESKFELSKKLMIDVNSLETPIKELVYKYMSSSNRPNYGYTKVKK